MSFGLWERTVYWQKRANELVIDFLSKWTRPNNYWYYESQMMGLINNSCNLVVFLLWANHGFIIFHAIPFTVMTVSVNASWKAKIIIHTCVWCSFTWTRNKAGLLHLLLNILPQFVSTKLLVHCLRRRLGPVAPVEDTWQVPSPKPLTAICSLCKRTHNSLSLLRFKKRWSHSLITQ